MILELICVLLMWCAIFSAAMGLDATWWHAATFANIGASFFCVMQAAARR